MPCRREVLSHFLTSDLISLRQAGRGRGRGGRGGRGGGPARQAATLMIPGAMSSARVKPGPPARGKAKASADDLVEEAQPPPPAALVTCSSCGRPGHKTNKNKACVNYVEPPPRPVAAPHSAGITPGGIDDMERVILIDSDDELDEEDNYFDKMERKKKVDRAPDPLGQWTLEMMSRWRGA